VAIPFAALARKSLNPLMVLCLIAAAVSCVAVLMTGVWTPLWPAVLGIMLSPLVFPVLLIPAAFFSGVMRLVQAVYPTVARMCMLLTFVWFIGTFGFYTFFVMHMTLPLGAAEATRLPALVWAVATAVLPWAILASQDRDNILFTGMVLMMFASAVIVAPLVFFLIVPYWTGFWIFCGMMAAMLSLQALYEHLFLDKTPPADAPAPAETPEG